MWAHLANSVIADFLELIPMTETNVIERLSDKMDMHMTQFEQHLASDAIFQKTTVEDFINLKNSTSEIVTMFHGIKKFGKWALSILSAILVAVTASGATSAYNSYQAKRTVEERLLTQANNSNVAKTLDEQAKINKLLLEKLQGQ